MERDGQGKGSMAGWLRAFLLLSGAVAQAAFAFYPELFGIEESIGGRSDASRTFLIPAGFAFVIWGPLFLGSLAFALYAFTPAAMRDPLTARVGWLAALSYWGNAAWALYTPARGPDWISFALLELILLPLLIAIILVRREGPISFWRGLSFAPVFGLGGWLTIASAAGVSLSANFTGFNPMGLGALPSAFLVLGGWTLLAAPLVWIARSLTYAGPIVWGLFFIHVANLGRGEAMIAQAALALAGAFVLLTIASKATGLTASRRASAPE
ncbi:MAG: hypothetical protein AAFX08_10505 [Pseudomonadota bacterium]